MESRPIRDGMHSVRNSQKEFATGTTLLLMTVRRLASTESGQR